MKLWSHLSALRLGAEDAMHLLESASGFEREAAIVALGRLRYAPALPRLLARANDWVPQVRTAAVKLIRAWLSLPFLPYWIGSLQAVLALERAGRADHGALLQDIRVFLGQPECMPAVAAAATRGSNALGRFAFRLQWEHAGVDVREQLVRAALVARDPLQARLAVPAVDSFSSASTRLELALIACASAFASVRADGLRILVRDAAPENKEVIEQLCLDSSTSVRAIAWQAVGNDADVAARLFAQAGAQLQGAGSVRARCAALEFLCMAAPALAKPLCEEALHAQASRIRGVAVSALLAWATGPEKDALLLEALEDPSPKVQRCAVRAIARGAAPPASALVLRAALSHGTAAPLRRAFAILRSAPAWDRLEWILKALEAQDLAEPLVLQCFAALQEWTDDARGNFVCASSAQMLLLHELWRRQAPRVPAPLRRRAEFHLNGA